MGKLVNDRQEKFAQLIATGVPAAQAYIEAGYNNPKFCPENARKLRNKKQIAARIAELMESTEDLIELRRRLLDRFLVATITIDRLRMFDEARFLRGDLSDEERALIEGVETTQHGPRYIMPRKLEAAAQLAKLHGLDKPDKSEVTGKDGAPLIPAYTDEQRVRALADFIARNPVPAA